MKKYSRALFDTSYLLPLFGIEVPGLNHDTIANIANELGAKPAYPLLLVPELLAKIGKVMHSIGLRKTPEEVIEALYALLLETDIELIQPRVEHLETAIELRALGHKDIFDNILYATSIHENTYLVTRDKAFIGFLVKNQLPIDHIITY